MTSNMPKLKRAKRVSERTWKRMRGDVDCSPKFASEEERAQAIRKALQLNRRGWSLTDIAFDTGVSVPVVHGWIKKEVAVLRERHAQERDADLQECIAGYLEVMREAWAAWERSKEDATEKTEKKRVDEGDEEGDIERPYSIVELVTSGRLPSNEYLRTVLDCWDRIRQLKGLETPAEGAAAGVAATVAFVAGVLEQARQQRECASIEARMTVDAVPKLKEESHAGVDAEKR